MCSVFCFGIQAVINTLSEISPPPRGAHFEAFSCSADVLDGVATLCNKVLSAPRESTNSRGSCTTFFFFGGGYYGLLILVEAIERCCTQWQQHPASLTSREERFAVQAANPHLNSWTTTELALGHKRPFVGVSGGRPWSRKDVLGDIFTLSPFRLGLPDIGREM